MRTDVMGGGRPPLEERLGRRFSAELMAAKADFPRLALRETTPAETGDRLPRRRFVVPMLTAAVIVIAVLGALLGPWRAAVVPGTSQSPTAGTSLVPTSTPTAAKSVVTDSNGVPTSIGGERVYRPVDVPAISATSFLLVGAAYEQSHLLAACPTATGPYPEWPPSNAAEATLLPATGLCDGRTNNQLVLSGASVDLGRLGPALPWGHLVVLRVHSHDPLAQQCTSERRDTCAAVLVPDAIVWDSGSTWVEMAPDGIPSMIGGEQVFRGAEDPGIALPDYLLGGLLERDTAASWACIQCTVWHIGSADVKATDNGVFAQLAKLLGERVVVRVHVESSRGPGSCATPCAPLDVIFVDAIVWHDGSTVIQIGPDGIPTAIGGERVYRSGEEGPGGSWLLGGTVSWGPPCPIPTGGSRNACLSQRIGSVLVSPGSGVDLTPFIDHTVVVRVHTELMKTVCTAAVCPPTIVVDAIVWSESHGAG